MKRNAIRLFALLLGLLMLTGCAGQTSSLPGTGAADEVEFLEWQSYDDKMHQAAMETDHTARALLLHEAEDQLMDSGAMIPLFHGVQSYLQKPDVSGCFVVKGDLMDVTHIRKEGASPKDPISLRIIGEPKNLDTGTSAAESMQIHQNISDGLLRLDEGDEVIPALAESYTVSEDACTYVFTLRDDLKWSDGSPLTAEDFVYSWKRMADTGNALENIALLDCIRGYPNDLCVSASEDGKTFTVELASPCAYFVELCTMPPLFPVKREQVESAPGYRDASGKVIDASAWAREGGIVSCGAYVVAEWKHNERITLKKNPYYYNADQVYAETLYLMLSNDGTSTYAAYRSGDVCLLFGAIPNDLVPALRNDPEYHYGPILNTHSISINVNAPIFKGMTVEEAKTFRKAIGWAIDRSFIVNVALTGIETPATTYVPKDMNAGMEEPFGSTPGYTYPEEDGYYSETADLDRAREMLTSIGFEFGKNGKLKDPITVEYMYNPAGSNELVAVCLQSDLAQLGIRLTLASREWNVFLGERRNGNCELARDGWNADYNDPNGMLALYCTGDPNNNPHLGQRPKP